MTRESVQLHERLDSLHVLNLSLHVKNRRSHVKMWTSDDFMCLILYLHAHGGCNSNVEV